MAIRTIAAIFIAADDETSFPNLIGTGSLVRDNAVLVHPPLSHELALGIDRGRLRVCVSSWATDGPAFEILDVAEVVVVEASTVVSGAEGTERVQPIVTLALAESSTAQVDPPLQTVDQFLRHLADPFNGPATSDDTGDNPNPLCKLFGIFC